MKIINILLIIFSSSLLIACGGGEKETTKQPKTLISTNKPVKENKAATTTGKVENPLLEKGIGPIKSHTLSEIDLKLAEEGKAIYEANCTACHKIEKKFVGPSLKGVLERRSPEWILNMILNPEEMIQKDPLAKQVMIENNMAVMANQNMTEDQAVKILEYFRTL